MQYHIKSMTQVCDELSAIGDPVNEENCVVYLLASLPQSYSVLVMALEANAEVPPLALATERLIHEEAKAKSRLMQLTQEGALAARSKKRPICYYSHKVGHIKKDCEEYAKVKGQSDRKAKVQTKPAQMKKKTTMGAFKVTITADDENSSDSEGCRLVVAQALSAGPTTQEQWILNSGATCHVCNKESIFTTLQTLKRDLHSFTTFSWYQI